jgi:hypothetical protein
MILVGVTVRLKRTLAKDLVWRQFYLAEISLKMPPARPTHYLYIIASFISHMRFMLLVSGLGPVG